MNTKTSAPPPLTPASRDEDLNRYREAGRSLAENMPIVGASAKAASLAGVAQAIDSRLRSILTDPAHPHARWLSENRRLIATAQKETRDLDRSLRHHPSASVRRESPAPRAFLIASEYLDVSAGFFTEESLAAYVEGFQQIADLEMGEIWALKPSLQLALLREIGHAGDGPPERIPVLIDTLRCVGEAAWEPWFEQVNAVDRVLSGDPGRAYVHMDYASRDHYRKALSNLAKHSGFSERAVAEAAVRFAASVPRDTESRWRERQRHVGFWLVDAGRDSLRAAIGYRSPLRERLTSFIERNAAVYYLLGVELVTLALVWALLEVLHLELPAIGALLLVLLPASQSAVQFMNNLTASLLPPRVLPKLDFSDGIPPQYATMVAVPTLLIRPDQMRELVHDLEIRYLANRDPNLYFALVSDSPDSQNPVTAQDLLAQECALLIEELNRKHGTQEHSPFFLFHRHPVYNSREDRWMGWERKRGKLIDLNQLMRCGFDAFPLKVGDLRILPRIQYVITLDSDTQLPRDAAHKLVGMMAHPLNRPVIDPETRLVVAGYGIVQPRVGISVHSASRSRLAGLYSGQTGFDIYTRAVSDVYQDLFGEGIFTGKGIYDVDAFIESLEHRFPVNALLSHDLIEGAYARAGLATDIEVIDDYPSHFSAYSRRKHRWVRGDWQILRWLWSTVPDFHGRIVPNPISVISRWKIFDNLRRSLFEPATMALLIAGWFWLREGPLYWTLASLALLLMPVWAGLAFSLLRLPPSPRFFATWAKDRLEAFVRDHLMVLIQIIFLPHQALLSADAIVRSILRVFVTRRRLLEWETAAEAELATNRRATVDRYLIWTPYIAMLLAGLLAAFRPAALPVAAPILFAWWISRAFSDFLNRAPRRPSTKLRETDITFLRLAAARTWRYFREFSTPDCHHLIPDNVPASGKVVQALSPTNLGLLLNARIAAVHFGYLSLQEFVDDTLATLDTVDRLETFRGHVLNWYSNETLEPLEPRFVSTVDSGNLAACLWTLQQAALAFAASPPDASTLEHGLRDMRHLADSGDPWWQAECVRQELRANELTPELSELLRHIASRCRHMADAMDFRFLYHRRRKVLSVGFDSDHTRREASFYDLLASESRMASFIAIAKGDIPQEAWFHLGRRHALVNGCRVLLSWTGTMFEYLMPSLWMRPFRNTIMGDSLEAAVQVQRDYGAARSRPWGVSEAACMDQASPTGFGYSAFGIPALAMKNGHPGADVVSPYSTFLALSVDPRCALANLREMEKRGWCGRYGFFESADYRASKSGDLVEMWMAHHVGMSLVAACNLLFDAPFQRYFHAVPAVQATELLLQERVPSLLAIDTDAVPPAA